VSVSDQSLIADGRLSCCDAVAIATHSAAAAAADWRMFIADECSRPGDVTPCCYGCLSVSVCI